MAELPDLPVDPPDAPGRPEPAAPDRDAAADADSGGYTGRSPDWDQAPGDRTAP